MSAELLSTLNAVRNQIENSSDDELLAHLIQGFSSVCTLMKKHPDELGERVTRGVLEEAHQTVYALLTLENQNNMQDSCKRRHTCEISEDVEVATLTGGKPNCSVQTLEQTDDSRQAFKQPKENLLDSATNSVALAYRVKSINADYVELMETDTNLSDRKSEYSSADENAEIAPTDGILATGDEILATVADESMASADDTSSSDSWYSSYTSISIRRPSATPVIDQNVERYSRPPTPDLIDRAANARENEARTDSSRPTVLESTASADDVVDCSLDSDDHTRYTAFDQKDYRIVGELLQCVVCETNVYSLNAHHLKLETHRKRVRAALRSTDRKTKHQPTLWQVTAAGFMKCNLCQTKFCVRTAHSSSELHAQSKEYKTSESVCALKRRVHALWKKLPTKVFDDLLTLRLAADDNARSFCVGCDRRLDTPAQRRRHERRSFEHRACVRTLKASNIFSYSFGILPKGNDARCCTLEYCVLCKIGVSNSMEHDNHVHGANSQHSARLRTFWSKVFPQLEEDGLLAQAFRQPVKDSARYSLDLSLDAQVNYFESLLHVIVISTDGFSLCSLCDLYVCGGSMKAHCDTARHAHMQRRFLNSFRESRKRSGIMKKHDMVYCVLCHVAFSNNVEATVHMNSTKPHLERVELFGRLFARFIKSVIRSG